ncbi:hypothetical protein THAOC_10555, partial [Thalassiosira oceanica]
MKAGSQTLIVEEDGNMTVNVDNWPTAGQPPTNEKNFRPSWLNRSPHTTTAPTPSPTTISSTLCDGREEQKIQTRTTRGAAAASDSPPGAGPGCQLYSSRDDFLLDAFARTFEPVAPEDAVARGFDSEQPKFRFRGLTKWSSDIEAYVDEPSLWLGILRGSISKGMVHGKRKNFYMKRKIAKAFGPLVDCMRDDTNRVSFQSNEHWHHLLPSFIELVEDLVRDNDGTEITYILVRQEGLMELLARCMFWIYRPGITKEVGRYESGQDLQIAKVTGVSISATKSVATLMTSLLKDGSLSNYLNSEDNEFIR